MQSEVDLNVFSTVGNSLGGILSDILTLEILASWHVEFASGTLLDQIGLRLMGQQGFQDQTGSWIYQVLVLEVGE